MKFGVWWEEVLVYGGNVEAARMEAQKEDRVRRCLNSILLVFGWLLEGKWMPEQRKRRGILTVI